MVLSLAATMKWRLWTADVSTAFLQGRSQDRKLWVKLPAEALALLGGDENARMLLLKPCYGQIDAPRGWYLEAVDRLQKLGLRQHALDPCAFLIYEVDDENYQKDTSQQNNTSHLGSQELVGVIIMHVDDLLGAGCPSSPRYNAVKQQLQEHFSFREWKEEEPILEYCGCEIEKTEAGGRKLHQTKYLEKVTPISYDKKRGTHESLHEREITQLRGLLGSLQWPAVQTSPHLQCSTSPHVNHGTVQTLADCNRLLKFAKEHKDAGLCYNHLGPAEQLRLVCFFDAGFSSRADGTSQGGYIVMLIHEHLLSSSEEGDYHVIDWRSFKTPRVSRSSLGAEAQAGGQASDAVDFICRYWHHLLEPDLPLRDLLKATSTLRPVVITDAKALYDSYHREGTTSSVVDRRVSLEIRVMKERLQELGGILKWVSSDRQIADGLTKEAARSLMALRIKHHRLKLTWDPEYKAMKKKSATEKITALKETTASTPLVHWQREDNDMDNEEVPQPDEGIPDEYVNMVTTEHVIVYAFASSHVGCRRQEYNTQCRIKNVMVWVLWQTMLQTCGAAGDQCEERPSPFKGDIAPPKEPVVNDDDNWFLPALLLVQVLLFAVIFLCGFVSGRRGSSTPLPTPPPATSEASTQKDELIVYSRLREQLLLEQQRSSEYRDAALEARRAIELNLEERNAWYYSERQHLFTMLSSAQTLLQRCENGIGSHMSVCPTTRPVIASKTGVAWHYEHCQTAPQINERNRLVLRHCSFCGDPRSPLDFPNASPSVGGGSLRTDMQAWFVAFQALAY